MIWHFGTIDAACTARFGIIGQQERKGRRVTKKGDGAK